MANYVYLGPHEAVTMLDDKGVWVTVKRGETISTNQTTLLGDSWSESVEDEPRPEPTPTPTPTKKGK